MSTIEIISQLKSMGSEHNRNGMARFGINTECALGISMAELKPFAKQFKKNHDLAIELWDSGFHEARILSILIDDPKKVTPEQMDNMVSDFNSWDVCDQAAMKLFCYTPYCWQKVEEWAECELEFTRRASFALIAGLCLHYKPKENQPFENSLDIILKYSNDERNFVKKAVNWALRQIGKRNLYLHQKALDCCQQILETYPNSKSARWIANDAIRELNDEKIISRIRKSRHN